MYSPKYTINNNILKNISIIEACKEVVENAPIIPAYERQFQEEALVRRIHHGTHVEGNDLTFEQAEKIIIGARGETGSEAVADKIGIFARERDIQEVINYRKVMEHIDEEFERFKEKEENLVTYTEDHVRKIHKITVYKIVGEENQGEYRKNQVILRDSRTGEVTFKPPPAVEVPYLMEDFVSWANDSRARETHPIIRAAISHYGLAGIHPFVEGNGRTARAFATLMMFLEGYDIKRLFSLEEYFDKDAESYYYTLIKTSNQSKELSGRDLTDWIEYFTSGLALELVKVKDKIRKLSIDSRIKIKRGQKVLLSERQIKIVEYVSENGNVRMGELRGLFPMVSEDTVLRDLQSLTESGIIRKHGKTKGAFYQLVT